MRRLPVFWLPLALAVLIISRCAIGLPTRSQIQQMISMILFEDELYHDMLSERVILKESDNLPKRTNEMVKNFDDVDPLVSLHALSTPHPYYLGDNLHVSLTIVGKSLACLMHKRVAFHLALIIGLIQNKDNGGKFKMRSRIITYAIPFYIDMLSSVYGNYDKLLSVFDLVYGMWSSSTMAEDAECEANIENLKKVQTFLSDVIKSSCVVHEMKQYCGSFKLDNLENCADKITDENIIPNLDVETSVATLMENENAILNMFDEMDWLRGMDMNAWKVWLKTPDLPPVAETEEFIRTPLPKYRNEFELIIEAIDRNIENENKLVNGVAEKKVEEQAEKITSPTESDMSI